MLQPSTPDAGSNAQRLETSSVHDLLPGSDDCHLQLLGAADWQGGKLPGVADLLRLRPKIAATADIQRVLD